MLRKRREYKKVPRSTFFELGMRWNKQADAGEKLDFDDLLNEVSAKAGFVVDRATFRSHLKEMGLLDKVTQPAGKTGFTQLKKLTERVEALEATVAELKQRIDGLVP